MGNFYDVTAVMQVIGGIYLNPSLLDAEEKYNFIEQDFKVIFDTRTYTLEELKDRLIKEGWLMYTCKDCQYYTWSNEDLEVKCKRGVNIDELYRVNNHRLTRRKCKKYKRKEGEK